MIRKTLLGLAAVVALGTAALAPTAASAGGYGYGYGYKSHYAPSYGYSSYNSYNYYQPVCFYKKVYGYYGYELVKVCR